MRRLSHDQRRNELIEAAIRVIARDGLAAASTRAIVSEAGMPLGSLHYIFASREDLLRAVVEQVTDDERGAAWRRIDGAGEGTDIRTLFAQGLEAYLLLLESDPGRELALLEVALHAVRHDPATVQAQSATYRRVAVDTLRHAAAVAGIRWSVPEDRLAWSLISGLDGLTVSWLTDRDGESARDHIDFLASSFAALAVPLATHGKDPQDAH
jgi:AcrR family transcriptional regulator